MAPGVPAAGTMLPGFCSRWLQRQYFFCNSRGMALDSQQDRNSAFLYPPQALGSAAPEGWRWTRCTPAVNWTIGLLQLANIRNKLIQYRTDRGPWQPLFRGAPQRLELA